MSTRKRKSGGQALVLVTLALFAMAGMIGLAVDLGWSFFVQKQAQAAADATALAAVQEAVVRIRAGGGTIAGFTCTGSGTGSTQVECTGATIEDCGSVTSTSNLNSGCAYAKKNSFDWTVKGSRQKVTLQSSDITTLAPPSLSTPTSLAVTAPVNISYWVTARTVQQIPQLFSAVFGNTLGTVSAISTAAIAGSLSPGSFYGMNHKGDCILDSKGNTHCGTDIYIGNAGSGQGSSSVCPGNPNTNGKLCAPAGIILASSCGSKVAGTCDDGVAGQAPSTGAGVEASSITIATGGTLTPTPPSNQWHDANGKALTPTSAPSSNSIFNDPTQGNPQPPLPSSKIASCGLPSGMLTGFSGKNTLTVQPYQFYAYTTKTGGGVPIPSGAPINVSGNLNFDASGKSCTQIGGYEMSGTSQPSGFPTYIFYGGVVQSGNTHFGAGQYVFAGTASGSSVFSSDGSGNGAITGDTATGTMFVFTDNNYPGMGTQLGNLPSALPPMSQGSLSFKNASITLSGLVNPAVTGSNLPTDMKAYSGIVWWQDRRNSNVGYSQDLGNYGCSNSTACTGDNGKVAFCALAGECIDGGDSTALAAMKLANHVTSSSPGVQLDPGNANLNLSGVYYQPRGAWVEFIKGTTGGSSTMRLQVITGAMIEDNGDTTVLLNGPTNPLQQFKTTLIQ